MLQILISEHVCGGGWPHAACPPSLAREGAAMLRAIIKDAARITGCQVTTTWDLRLGNSPFPPGVSVREVAGPKEEAVAFAELQRTADRVLVIAPEFNEILAKRCELITATSAGSDPAAIRLCADKLALATHFTARAVPTIPTGAFHLGASLEDLPFPIVVKPRDGAGSQSTYLIRSEEEFIQRCSNWAAQGELRDAIWQPFVAGQAVSVAVFVSPESNQYEACPVCEQTLSDDGRFEYAGGIVPARLGKHVGEAIQKSAVAACRNVPGLRGYVGVDLIVPAGGTEIPPVLVEINPRLTTSYLGLRRLTTTNLAARVLGLSHAPVAWLPQARLRFTADGQITTE